MYITFQQNISWVFCSSLDSRPCPCSSPCLECASSFHWTCDNQYILRGFPVEWMASSSITLPETKTRRYPRFLLLPAPTIYPSATPSILLPIYFSYPKSSPSLQWPLSKPPPALDIQSKPLADLSFSTYDPHKTFLTQQPVWCFF